MTSYVWPPIGSHYIYTAGKHTTTLDSSSPYQNVVSVPGVLSSDIVIASIESMASAGTPASANFTDLEYNSFTAYYPGAAGNNIALLLNINPEDSGQTEDWLIALNNVPGVGVGIDITPKGTTTLTYNGLVAALNAAVTGTYDGTLVTFSGSGLDDFYFTGGSSALVSEDSSPINLLGGADEVNTVNLQGAAPSADSITFKFKEPLIAGHVISYQVLRAV